MGFAERHQMLRAEIVTAILNIVLDEDELELKSAFVLSEYGEETQRCINTIGKNGVNYFDEVDGVTVFSNTEHNEPPIPYDELPTHILIAIHDSLNK
jgi:hypothetical protein